MEVTECKIRQQLTSEGKWHKAEWTVKWEKLQRNWTVCKESMNY